MLGVDIDDVADGDDRQTVGARLRVSGRRSFGGHASHAAPRLSREVAANPVSGNYRNHLSEMATFRSSGKSPTGNL